MAVRMKQEKTNIQQSGFTLVELMITLAISSIIVAAIYSAYKTQRDVYEAQVQVTEIQQNLRAATWHMVRDIRMAGYDPACTGNYQIKLSDALGATDTDSLRFDADLCKDGGMPVDTATDCTGAIESPEKFLYELYTPAVSPVPGYTTALRALPNGQAIAENIEALEFSYTLDDGTLLAGAPTTADEAERIKTIQISILGRARRPDPNFSQSGMTYTTASGGSFGPYSDNYRRQLLITSVMVRNQGLCK